MSIAYKGSLYENELFKYKLNKSVNKKKTSYGKIRGHQKMLYLKHAMFHKDILT